MLLNHRQFGQREDEIPLILIHGLLGSSRNWVTIAGRLGAEILTYALDLRNHGESNHHDEMSYDLMKQDLINWMDSQAIQKAHWIGHSMGGKLAMILACNHPERVESLTIADIAPKNYSPHFRIAFDAMLQVDPSRFSRLKEVEEALSEYLEDAEMRQFLLTNLRRNARGSFDWIIHLQAIQRALAELSANPLHPESRYEGYCQLLYGEKSDIVNEADHATIIQHFPKCAIIEIQNAGHNIHIDERNQVVDAILKLVGNSAS